MAVTTITPTQLAYNTASASLPITGGTAIVAGNEHKIAYPQEGKLLIILNNTYAGAKTFTVKAGDFLAKGQGDLEISLAQNEVKFLVVSSDRLKDTDDNVVIEVAASTTGFIMAFYMP